MNVYQTDESGIFVGITIADESPLEPGVYLIPRGCVQVAPPALSQGQRARWTGTDWTIEAAAAPIPVDPVTLRAGMSLSFRQLLIGLVARAWITEAEGDGWLVGVLPPAVINLIATLPNQAQFPARASALRPSSVLRLDPLVISLGQAQGKTDDEMDEFFTTFAGV